VSAECSAVQARGSESSTESAAPKIDECGVHSNDDDGNEHSNDVVDPSAGMAPAQESCMPSAVTETGNCGVHSNSNEWNAHSSTDVVDPGWNAHSIEVVDFSARVSPTQEAYPQLQTAYGYFNWHLFDNALPNCLITLQRRGRTYGYYAPDRFGRKDGRRTDEIALNPQYFRDGTEEILSTLVHEMAHVWQHHLGKPSRPGYHNAEWAEKMRRIGLHPSSTGREGGKETGDVMAEYIVADGPFARAVAELLAGGFDVTWTEVTAEKGSSPDSNGTGQAGDGRTGQAGDRGSLSGKRAKYSCPYGDLNAWAKPGAKLVCGEHWVAMEPVRRP
jgi:hypothetical protein